MISNLFEGYPAWFVPTLTSVLALVLSYVLADGFARLVRNLLLHTTGRTRAQATDPRVRRPVVFIRRITFLILVVVLLFPALDMGGFQVDVGFDSESIAQWLFRSGLRVGLIILLAYALIRVVSVMVDRLEERVSAAGDLGALERAKRVRTVGSLLRNVFGIIAGGLALLMILHELGIDITPLLAGAGIAGLAVGFGAQALVKDLISGFFMLIEDQVRVGDVVVINGTGGAVEAITLRTILLRDLEGIVHVFPNGSITTLANRTKDYSYAVLDVGVAYKEDTDRVTEVLRHAAGELAADPAYAPLVLEPLEVLGVDGFMDSAVTIKVRIKTVPQQQWAVARELRRRIKKAFDSEGIEIPFPHLSVYFGEKSRPFQVVERGGPAAEDGPPADDAGPPVK